MYAVWLMFDKADEDYLCDIISDLSKKYSAPKFIPHITVYGLIDYSLDYIQRAVLKSIEEIKPFRVTTTKLSYTDYFWKAVFAEFENNDSMNKINHTLETIFQKNYEFVPHASLIYKTMTMPEKKKLTQSLNIKNEFHINRIGIQQFSRKISQWKIISEWSL